MTGLVLIADVGGSNARFGVSRGSGDVCEVRSYQAARFASFAEAMCSYLGEADLIGDPRRIREARIAAAGPVQCGRVSLTNLPWQIEAAEISANFGVPTRLYNDLEAVAMLLPHINASGVDPIGRAWPIAPSGTRIAVNVGTGLGAAAAHRFDDGRWVVTPSEAGHMAFAARTEEERPLLAFAASIEDVLSGGGVERLYRHLEGGCGDRSVPRPSETTAQIFERAGRDPTAARLVQLFTSVFGRAVGDLVLAHGAWGGAFLCGSVARGWRSVADIAAFRASFEGEGKMRARMGEVPTWLITRDSPALYGLSYAS